MSNTAGWKDTIVALATPPGIGAIGVIRLSGPDAIGIVNRLFVSRDLSDAPSHTLHVGMLREGGQDLDQAVVSLYRTPRSYTGEDVAEISAHGSPFVLQQLIDACLREGARLARPGEFTQRAFLNGKLDLTQAEAVADLIASNTRASTQTALRAIRGGFSRNLSDLREKLIRFSALIELELDFSQEDVQFADRAALQALIGEMDAETGRLIASFRAGNVIRHGVSVAIVGKPNAGKSTLLNTLLNENRAIVSEIAGTTRDTIEEVLNIDGILFRLIDTAGIRSHTADRVEREGIQRSLDKIRTAELVLYLFDATDPDPDINAVMRDLQGQQVRFLLVINKTDLIGEQEARYRFASAGEAVYLSAREGHHIEVLRERMVDQVLGGAVEQEHTIVTNARHYHALCQVQESLAAIRNGMEQRLSGDLLAPDIRRCLHYLGEITGEVTTEDQLDYIFSKFCIGK